MRMFFLSLLLLLCVGHEEVKSEVDNGFVNCNDFFYKGIAPVLDYVLNAVEEYAPTDICQKLRNNPHYATKYTKYWRVPLFSAYTLVNDRCVNRQAQRRQTWFVEPQVRKLTPLFN